MTTLKPFETSRKSRRDHILVKLFEFEKERRVYRKWTFEENQDEQFSALHEPKVTFTVETDSDSKSEPIVIDSQDFSFKKHEVELSEVAPTRNAYLRSPLARRLKQQRVDEHERRSQEVEDERRVGSDDNNKPKSRRSSSLRNRSGDLRKDVRDATREFALAAQHYEKCMSIGKPLLPSGSKDYKLLLETVKMLEEINQKK